MSRTVRDGPGATRTGRRDHAWIPVRGVLALVAADGAVPVSPGSALPKEMPAGWRNQQQARRLTARLTGERERDVRQFTDFTGCWPWQWTAARAEGWLASGGWAHSTVRSYQGALALFLDYACDPRYGWVSECEQRAVLIPFRLDNDYHAALTINPDRIDAVVAEPVDHVRSRRSRR